MTSDIVIDCYSHDKVIGSTKISELTPNFDKQRPLSVQLFDSASVRISKAQFREIMYFKRYINHLKGTYVKFFIEDGLFKLKNIDFSYSFYTYGDDEISTKRYNAQRIIQILEYLFKFDDIVYIVNAKINNHNVLALYNSDEIFVIAPTDWD